MRFIVLFNHEEYTMEYNIQIAGFKSNINDFGKLMNNISEIRKNCTIQLLNADGIAGYEHIFHATVHELLLWLFLTGALFF